MKFLSVCSGIEAASVAWNPLGFEAVAFSEIDKFPSAVLAHHYPTIPNLGDMTKAREWPDYDFDILVGGTPCQSFSVAGLRKGLADPRGNLMLTYLAIADRYQPEWLVWENVPGVLSSGSGRDFGTFLGALGQIGYGWAYRILDAQYFGVPQRRRRVFVVGHLGDWRRAAAVLFERHSLQGHPPPSREKREGTTYPVAPCIGASDRGFERTGDTRGNDAVVAVAPKIGSGNDFSGPILANYGDKWGLGDQEAFRGEHHVITHSLRAEGFDASEDGTGRGTPLVSVFDPNQITSKTNRSSPTPELCHTLPHTPNAPIAFNHQENRSFVASSSSTNPLRANQTEAIAFALQDDTTPKTSIELNGALRRDAGGNGARVVYGTLSNTNCHKGINKGDDHASTQERDTASLLSRVRKEIGAQAFAEWGLGILDSLQSPEILRSALHGGELRPTRFSRRWVVHCALSREEARAAGAMLSLLEACGEGCPSQGWGPLEQLAGQLGTYLSELSQPGAQAERLMHDLWAADEGTGILREALSAIQKVWRPVAHEGQSAHGGMQVRRLTCEECEFLQGFPRGYTNIPFTHGKLAADGPRYKALGNSMAVPCMRWIGERIQLVDWLYADS